MEIVARFKTDVFIVMPADAVALARVKVLFPVPCDAKTVVEAATPDVVVTDRAVAVSITAGFTVIVNVIRAVAPDASVAVTVSVMVRATVVDVDVSVDARRTNAVVAVEVSIVTPAFSPESEKDLVPEPEAVV
jgi:hypothetical protein